MGHHGHIGGGYSGGTGGGFHHHHHHHQHHKPTVVPTPAVRLHSRAPCETTPLVSKNDELTGKQCLIATVITILVTGIIVAVLYFNESPTMISTPEIGLKNFSVSNLNITDDQISANWAIGLCLFNRDGDTTANYTDIRYTMIYCGDPSGQFLIDSHKEYADLVLPRNNQTVVYLKDSVEKLGFNKVALSYMIMDLASDGILEFDLVVKVTVVKGTDRYRLMLSCEGIEVSISDSHDGSGSARFIPRCDVARVK